MCARLVQADSQRIQALILRREHRFQRGVFLTGVIIVRTPFMQRADGDRSNAAHGQRQKPVVALTDPFWENRLNILRNQAQTRAFSLKRGPVGVGVVLTHRAQRFTRIKRVAVVPHFVLHTLIGKRADRAGGSLQLAVFERSLRNVPPSLPTASVCMRPSYPPKQAPLDARRRMFASTLRRRSHATR